VKCWDLVIVGAGVIGLSLSVELRRSGLSVMLLERHQPGHEASWAAGGMLADCEAGEHPLFHALARASAAMYPAFVQRLQDESGIDVDLRQQGTIRFLDTDRLLDDGLLENDRPQRPAGVALTPEELHKLEPELAYSVPAVFLAERCVDPRLLTGALLKSARHLGVDLATGTGVTDVVIAEGKAVAALTARARYPANAIVNCAGAWASQLAPVAVPTRPVKGQMLAVTPALVKHVVRGNGVYLIPRGNGRLVIGATVEEAGFDKRVEPETIQRLHQAASVLAPNLGQARILEDWAGLRPGTPDELPIMGATAIPNYFVATGHYRDGILLAPITAQVMAQLIRNETPDFDLSGFSLARFQL
jgi:glycine oxidase ThiO